MSGSIRRMHHVSVAVGFLALIHAWPLRAAQIDTNWLGGAGNWSDPVKWSAGVPNNGANTFNVFIDAGLTGTASVVTLNQASTIDNLTIDAGDTLSIPDSRNLTILDNGALAGTISNAGTIATSSAGNNTGLVIGNGTVTLTGGGTISFGNNPSNRIAGLAATDHFINVDNLIQGSGNIGQNTILITNQASGIITANQPNALSIDPAGSMTNAGILRATGGRTLQLLGATYANVGGTIEALDASSVSLLSGAVIAGGTLQTSGTGAIRGYGGSALDGSANVVTNSGAFAISDNNTVSLLGTISNTGTISTSSAGNNTGLSVSGGDVTLTGGGTVTMGNNSDNRITGSAGTDRLINLNNTIQGSGNIGQNAILITNEAAGVILANQSHTLTIDPNGAMTNNGTMRAADGTLALNAATYENANGVVEALADGTVNLNGGAIVEGGVLQTAGNGVIQGLADSTLDGAPNSVSNTGRLHVPDNNTANLLGTIANSGQITTASAGNATGFRIGGGDVTLTGGGTVTLGNNPSNRFTGTGGTDRLINTNHTIQGSGNIGANVIELLNQSLIVANQSHALTIDPGATMTNTGTLRATNGGTLVLAGGTYVNAGGVIEAQNDSAVNLNSGAVIDRGTLQTSGTGVIQGLSGSTLNGAAGPVNNTGSFNVPTNNTTGLLGTITNSGVMSSSSSGNPTGFSISGNVTLNGGGKIAMSNNPANRITGSAPTDTLINTNHTIEGSGNVGANAITINNQGLIRATLSNDIVIDPATDMTNTGTLRADGGVLTLNPGIYANTGGTVEALDGDRVDLSGATIDGGTLTSAGTGYVRGINVPTLDGSVHPITNSGTFNIPDNHSVNMKGTLINSGNVSLTTAGNVTRLRVGAGGLTLTGGGTVTLNNNPANRFEGASATDVLTNQDNTIQGSGNIGVNFMGLINQGLVLANVSNDLTIDPATSMTNTGTLRAASGGTLALNPGTYNNVGGVIEAFAGSRVDIGAATIVGGTLQTSGSGVIRSFGATLDGSTNTPTNTGAFNIPDNTSLTIKGTINNTGTISLTTAGNTTTLRVDGSATVTGGGGIAMSSNPANGMQGVSAADRLTNSSTISGAGNIGRNAMALTNSPTGTIVATQNHTLTIDVTDSESFINQGSLQANGGDLSIAAGPFTQFGSVRTYPGSSLSRTGSYTQTGGSTIINGGLSASSGVAINGGTLGGTGTVSSPVTTATGGAVNPGDPGGIPTGTLTIASTYSPSATGALNIELAGVATGQADKLAVTGAATLDGTLNIVLLPGYTPAAGDKFTIMTYGSHTGQFATITGAQISPTLSFFVLYGANQIRIAARAGCGGSFACDTNCDGTVNQFDINAFIQAVATHQGCHACAGDANGDGTTNTFDINQFLTCLTP